MERDKVHVARLDEIEAAEMRDGLLLRRTMAYNEDLMLCHFTLEEGLNLPQHKHDAVQVGYVLSGKVKFSKGDGTSFVATGGTSYIFDSNEVHGIDEVYEKTEFIECFSPYRSEYI